MTPYEKTLIDQGLARLYRGRLIPIMRGGSDAEDEALFDTIPEDLSSLTDEELSGLVTSFEARIQEIASGHDAFLTEDRDVAALLDETSEAVEALSGLRAEVKAREVAAAAAVVEEPAAVDPSAALAELASRARAEAEPEDDAPEDEDPPADPPAEEAAVVDAPIVAGAAPAARPPLPVPAPSRRPAPAPAPQLLGLTAAAGAQGLDPGSPFDDMNEIAAAMIRRRKQFGIIPEGTSGETFSIARGDWSHLYPAERKLSDNLMENMGLIAAATRDSDIRAEMDRRRKGQMRGEGLVASGGLCAPVTPYYQLQYISVADRPVRGALPSFNADRGGIRYARPAGLSSIDTAVGIKTVTQDAAGGTAALKSCQVIDCPPFQETDVDTIYHCLQFGNLGARAFPELVAQWNNLVLAAQARVAEANLLTGIDTFSTQITAATMGLGVVGDLLGQVLVAAASIRSRNRMSQDAVLRAMFPAWVLPMMVSDVIRSQFERFDTDEEKLTAWFRQQNIEPTFYIDGANGKSQVFGPQTAAGLLEFPSTVTWYLYPEGSFLFVDGGSLELGIVRDSVLNSTNDYQIFGETFENVAFVGIESYAVTSTVCDSGVVAAPHATSCPSY